MIKYIYNKYNKYRQYMLDCIYWYLQERGPSLNCACHGFDGFVDIVTDDASTAPATTIGNR